MAVETYSEERKMILLGLFYEALAINGLSDLLLTLEFCWDEFWSDMSADQIWREQAECLNEEPEQGSDLLPEDLAVFSKSTPDWGFAEANLRQYGQTF